MKEIRVRATFTEDCLGTASADPKIHDNFIASNAPDAMSREEEIEALGVEEVSEKSKTIFPKDKDGNPFFFDYQIKGFFKGSCSDLQRCKGEKFSKASCKIKAYKKVIDGCIFVFPRKIPITLAGPIGDLQRPLRAQTAKGERISLANSETIPAGSSIEFTIKSLSDEYVPAIMEWLDYGALKGIGQWRNASYGRFEYEILYSQRNCTAMIRGGIALRTYEPLRNRKGRQRTAGERPGNGQLRRRDGAIRDAKALHRSDWYCCGVEMHRRARETDGDERTREGRDMKQGV